MRPAGGGHHRVVRTPIILLPGVLLLSACASGADDSAPPTPVPSTTVPVSIEAPVPCSQMEPAFTPLEVAASDYLVTLQTASPCTEGKGLTILVFNVPVPPTGAVQLNPGNQPAATFAAEDAGGGVRVVYQQDGNGFSVASIDPPLTP